MRSKKPKIGITLSETNQDIKYRWPARKAFDYVKHEYFEAIIHAGGMPILLANVDSLEIIKDYMESVDGLLLTGGGDMHSRFYGQAPHSLLGTTTRTRDSFEIEALELALKSDKPILGICRGHQVLNVAFGGTLYQDLTCLKQKTLTHADPRQTAKIFHKVKIEKGSKLYGIIGSEQIETNSSHHQVIDKLGRGFKATAWAPDGLIEAIEHNDYDFVIGVQWHPEGTIKRLHSRRLFEALVRKTRRK